MSSEYSGRDGQLHAAEIFRDKWLWLALLGSVLIVSGILQIMQSANMLHWIGFVWHLMLAILATLGGILIYLDPFAGVVTIALIVSMLLVMKLPYTHSFTPATVAGVPLLFAGWAHVAMALAARKAADLQPTR